MKGLRIWCHCPSCATHRSLFCSARCFWFQVFRVRSRRHGGDRAHTLPRKRARHEPPSNSTRAKADHPAHFCDRITRARAANADSRGVIEGGRLPRSVDHGYRVYADCRGTPASIRTQDRMAPLLFTAVRYRESVWRHLRYRAVHARGDHESHALSAWMPTGDGRCSTFCFPKVANIAGSAVFHCHGGVNTVHPAVFRS